MLCEKVWSPRLQRLEKYAFDKVIIIHQINPEFRCRLWWLDWCQFGWDTPSSSEHWCLKDQRRWGWPKYLHQMLWKGKELSQSICPTWFGMEDFFACRYLTVKEEPQKIRIGTRSASIVSSAMPCWTPATTPLTDQAIKTLPKNYLSILYFNSFSSRWWNLLSNLLQKDLSK